MAAPIGCPWGEKALGGYLCPDRKAWADYDACALIAGGAKPPGPILVDQGEADPFLAEQLKPELLAEACGQAGVDLTLRRQPGYDHSYFFIASLLGDQDRKRVVQGKRVTVRVEQGGSRYIK